MQGRISAEEYTKSKSDSDFTKISHDYENISLSTTTPISGSYVDSMAGLTEDKIDPNLQKRLNAEMNRNRRLEEELNVERMKNQGLETIFHCIQEEKLENKKLMTTLTRQKHTIKKLKKKLQQFNSLSDQMIVSRDEISDISEGDESITKETDRFRKLVRQELDQRERHHKNVVDELQTQITQLERDKENLSQLVDSSNDDHIREIVRLRRELQTTNKTNEANTVRCQTLSEETVQLKRRLGETIDTCQNLMQSLDKQQKQQNQVAEQAAIENNKMLSGLSSSSDDSSLATDYRRQKSNLETQLKEVVSMNSRWQQYNEQREEYVQQLLQRVVELEQALINRGEQLSTSQQEQIDELLMKQKQKLDIAEETKATLELENRKLKRLADELRRNCQQNDGSVAASFKAQLEKCTRDLLAERDNTQMLTAQIQMNQEDFRCERRDRERAQERIDALEQELAAANQQLALYGVGAPRMTITDQRTRYEHFRRGDIDSYPDNTTIHALVGRGVTSDLVGRDTIAGRGVTSSHSASFEDPPTERTYHAEPAD